MKRVRLLRGYLGSQRGSVPSVGGCPWPEVKEEARSEGDLMLPLGSSPEQLGLSGK